MKHALIALAAATVDMSIVAVACWHFDSPWQVTVSLQVITGIATWGVAFLYLETP